MAKNKKGKNSGNPVLNALTEILNGMSPEEKMMLMPCSVWLKTCQI